MFFDPERFWYLLGAAQFSVSFVIIGMNKLIKLDVFGKQVLAIHTNDGWEMFYLSEGGKRRLATEIFVPNFVKEKEIEKRGNIKFKRKIKKNLKRIKG